MRIRDSLSGELRELRPGADGAIGMYVCGPTVYNRIHVGNARPFVVFQLMKRYLEWRGQPVLLVENITDINDKIYAAAERLGVPSDGLAREMSEAYIADTDLLGLGRPDREPRATETMVEIVALIAELIAGGHAYEAGGDVYFAVRTFDR
jgi:cysteinyl-tRNA synthetase